MGNRAAHYIGLVLILRPCFGIECSQLRLVQTAVCSGIVQVLSRILGWESLSSVPHPVLMVPPRAGVQQSELEDE